MVTSALPELLWVLAAYGPWIAADILLGEGYSTIWDTAKGILQAWDRFH